MSTDNEPDTVDVSHIVGLDIQIGPYRRQRCAWCGQLLLDEDLSRMAWQLNLDGTDPGPPGVWPMGAVVEVVGELGSFRGVRIIPEDEWPQSVENPENKALPVGCCAKLDPAVTA